MGGVDGRAWMVGWMEGGRVAGWMEGRAGGCGWRGGGAGWRVGVVAGRWDGGGGWMEEAGCGRRMDGGVDGGMGLAGVGLGLGWRRLDGGCWTERSGWAGGTEGA